jgi:glycosyltransferase involved in cell wall biosynthesis
MFTLFKKYAGKKPEPNIAILLFPFAAPNVFEFSHKTVSVFSSVAGRTFFISGGIPRHFKWPENVEIHDIGIRLHYLNARRPASLSAAMWLCKALLAQILMTLKVFQLSREINIVYCAMGVYYQIPILLAKLLGKRILTAALGDYSQKAKMNYGKIFAHLTGRLARFNYYFSDGIIVESFRLAGCKDLLPYRSKLLDGALFLENPESYRSNRPAEERPELVGFIGRMVVEKGILDFLDAIPLILDINPGVQFLIIGAGILDAQVGKILSDAPWAERVTRLGWVNHAEILGYLNSLRLLVVPSYDEGLPNLILEAMGCGTPVLASTAGGIPDLISHGNTGFVIESICSQEIATAVLSALGSPNLPEISRNARALIDQNYTFSAARRRFGAILDNLLP